MKEKGGEKRKGRENEMERESIRERKNENTDWILGVSLCLAGPLSDHLMPALARSLVLILIELTVGPCILTGRAK